MAIAPKAQFLSHVAEIEQEVLQLRDEVARLKEIESRWQTLHEAGLPFRQIAASEYLHDQQQRALLEDKRAGDAERKALLAKKALEQAQHESSEHCRRAEEAAQKLEDSVADAERAFNTWQQRAEVAVASAEQRHTQVVAQALAHLEAAEADAEARSDAAAERYMSERDRCFLGLEQERERLERMHDIAKARADEHRSQAARRVHAAETATTAAERHLARQEEAAQRREERALAAVRSKVSLATSAHDEARAQADSLVEEARKNGEKQLEAARAREAAALEDLARRSRRSEAQACAAQKAKDSVHALLTQVEAEQELRVQKLRSEVDAKRLAWETMADGTEAFAQQKAGEVGTLSDRLAAAMATEVSLTKEQLQIEAADWRNRSASHQELLAAALGKHQLHTKKVSKLADCRVIGAETLTKKHVAQALRYCNPDAA